MPTSKYDFSIKRNDTLPSLRIGVTNKGCLGQNKDFDMTGATGVTFTMVDSTGSYKIAKKDGTIVSSSGGTIQYDWASEDTDEAGSFKGEFQINYSNGGRLTIPQQGFITIHIAKDITFD